MAVIAVSNLGENIAFVAANAGGDTVASGIEGAAHYLEPVFLLVDNGDASPHTVTVDGAEHVVPAGEQHAIGANRGVYPGTALDVTYDGVTSVTVAAVRAKES